MDFESPRLRILVVSRDKQLLVAVESATHGVGLCAKGVSQRLDCLIANLREPGSETARDGVTFEEFRGGVNLGVQGRDAVAREREAETKRVVQALVVRLLVVEAEHELVTVLCGTLEVPAGAGHVPDEDGTVW